tara:strand:+ start:234 stop:1307 length:1074 start_codon:yes stop_codon:yes gene_type:complete
MKKEFDNSYVENSTLNAFVRNLVENKYTARNLLGVIKTINPNNFEVQTPEMPATQKSIISNPKTEMLKEAKYGGYNGYNYRSDFILNFKNKETADLFESIYVHLIKSVKEKSLTIEQKRLLEDDRNTQTRMTEKKEVGIKNFEIKNNGKGAVLIRMDSPIFLNTRSNDPEEARRMGESKVFSQIFEEITNAALNSGLYQSQSNSINNLQKRVSKNVYINEEGRAIVPTKDTKKALSVFAIERSDKLSELIREEIQKSRTRMLNTKLMALQRDTAESLMTLEDSKVSKILQEQREISQRKINNNKKSGLRSLLRNISSNIKQTVDNVVNITGDNYELPSEPTKVKSKNNNNYKPKMAN